MAESILVTGKKISSMELVTNVQGTEKIPTGQPEDLAITPNQIKDFVIEQGDLVNQSELETEVSQLQTSITNTLNLSKNYTDTKVGVVGIALEEHVNDQTNPHQVTKEQVGLGEVDNTSDVNKPVSNATQVLVDGALNYIKENGAALPYSNDVTYNDRAIVLKEGELVQKNGDSWDKVKTDYATELKTANSQTQQEINDSIGAKWYAKEGGYPLHSRIMLENGNIVRNTVANNSSNPNSDMTGWVKIDSTSQIFDESGNNQESINNYNKSRFSQFSTYTVKPTPSEQVAEINSINSGEAPVYTPLGNYALNDTIIFNSNNYNYSQKTKFIAGSSLFGFRLEGSANIFGGNFFTSAGVTFNLASGVEKASIKDVVIENTSPSNATAINMNANNISDVSIIDNHIETNGFGILTNGAGTNIDGIIIALNNITSKSDPVELNAPNGKIHKNIPVIGNILRANRDTSDHVAGFAIGIAAAKNIPVIGNAIRESKNEAVHIEDTQDTVTVVGNVAESCKNDFIRVQNSGVNGAAGGGAVTIVGNNGVSFGTGLNNSGFYNVWDVAGSVNGNSVVANRFKNFTYGIRGGSRPLIATANIIENSETGIFLENIGGVFGENYMRGVVTAVKANNTQMIGGVVVYGTHTKLIDTSSITSGLGVNLTDGFKLLSVPSSLTAGVATTIPLFDAPTLCCGRLIVRVRQPSSNTNYVYASADILYDGTTVTVDKKLNKNSGDMSWSGLTFNISGGKFNINIFSATSKDVEVDVIYKGEFYK